MSEVPAFSCGKSDASDVVVGPAVDVTAWLLPVSEATGRLPKRLNPPDPVIHRLSQLRAARAS